MKSVVFFLLPCTTQCGPSLGFTPKVASQQLLRQSPSTKITGRPLQLPFLLSTKQLTATTVSKRPILQLNALQQDLDVIGLVAGQENYGLAIVCVGEALWSFLSAPSFDHAKVLIPAGVAAIVLILVSGPMITSGDFNSVGTGLWIATGTSTVLGISYIARMIASYSPSPKEIAAFGLLVAVAGFFSFAQNLFVAGFIALPSLPTLPSFELPNLSNIVNNDVVLDVEPMTTSVDVLPPIEPSTSIPDIVVE